MTRQQAHGKLILGAAMALGLSLLVSSGAHADALLTYTGNDFTNIIGTQYTTSDRITATITLPSPLGDNLHLQTVFPTVYSINDGVQTITQADTGGVGVSLFQFSTSATGAITQWDIDVATPSNPPFILIINAPGDVQDLGNATSTGAGEEGYNQNDPGSFVCTSGCSSSTPVPEPTSLLLLGSALAGLGLLRRRRKSVLKIGCDNATGRRTV